MAWLRASSLVFVISLLGGACSSGSRPESGSSASEPVGSVSQAITAACGFDTIGLPCDPDGPAGPKLECEGVCAIGTAGLASCRAVAAGTLDGVICGTTNGVGDGACKRYCNGKTCLGENAPAGAACRPTSKSSPCEGSCDGGGKCKNVATPCDFGRDDQLCQFFTCDFASATSCVTQNLLKNTLCSDTNACSIGKCSSTGKCVAGPLLGCDDGNACTDDSCDPNDGGCVGVNDDTNPCSDGNACFTGEHCVSGTCVAGTVAVDCDDGNLCTTDSCDPNTGCAHVADTCNDGDACTQDDCDASDGSCSHPPLSCDDNDDCTIDSCDSSTGCANVAMDCDDADACTADSCSAGACSHEAIGCDDGDPCTADSCDAVAGCQHSDIADCGQGGAGGEPAGGGAPSAGGAPGSAGAADGGEPAAQGGAEASGEGGMPAGVGGEGEGASGANAGTPSTGASAGTAGAQSGSGASGGDVAGGAGGAGASDHTAESSGCGCRVGAPQRHANVAWAALSLLGLALLRRRRA